MSRETVRCSCILSTTCHLPHPCNDGWLVLKRLDVFRLPLHSTVCKAKRVLLVQTVPVQATTGVIQEFQLLEPVNWLIS